MRRSSSWIAVLPSLVIPVCLGLMMYLALAYSINQGHITNDTVLRYLTGHPVSKVTLGMFFIGLASLLLVANDVFEQFSAEKKITLGAGVAERDHDGSTERQRLASSPIAGNRAAQLASDELSVLEQANRLSERLSDLPRWLHNHYLWQRLQSGLSFARRTESTEGIEDELKYLADLDLDQQQQRYSLVQILIWATPMLGFLGTVLGISQALGGINVGPNNNLQTMMDGLRGNLYIAFDTTALALTLSMLLMFGQFLIDRFETQLLLLVDHRAQGELNRYLPNDGKSSSGSYQNLADSIVDANRQSTKQQTEIWKKTIRSAEKAWASTLTDTNLQVQDSMSVALDENVANLAHYLGEAIDKADSAMTHRWQQWQVTLSENARQLAVQQHQLCEQTELLQNLFVEKEFVPLETPTPVESTAAATSEKAQLEPATEDLPLPILISRVDSNGSHRPEPESPSEQNDSREFESPQVINFQSYLDGVLSRSVDQNVKPGSRLGLRGTQDEVVLPFRFVSPNNSSGSNVRPDKAA